MAGYHINNIPTGKFGEFSKIQEEFLEFKDSIEQKASIMALLELADMLGAIKSYFKLDISQVKKNMNKEMFFISYEELVSIFEVFELKKEDYLVEFLMALNSYVGNFNMSLEDLEKMSEITERVFNQGYRIPKE